MCLHLLSTNDDAVIDKVEGSPVYVGTSETEIPRSGLADTLRFIADGSVFSSVSINDISDGDKDRDRREPKAFPVDDTPRRVCDFRVATADADICNELRAATANRRAIVAAVTPLTMAAWVVGVPNVLCVTCTGFNIGCGRP